MKDKRLPLHNLLDEIRACRRCETQLPLGPRPVLRAEPGARLLIVGQAPGTRVHETGIPWNDPSGERLREWMGVDRETFYDASRIAVMPMGFCYPGRGRSGDLPPRPECAAQWHERVLAHLPRLDLILLVGQYAQRHYLPRPSRSLAERVGDWRDCAPPFMPLVHPSPRNTYWLRKNPWFEEEVVPALKRRVAALLG